MRKDKTPIRIASGIIATKAVGKIRIARTITVVEQVAATKSDGPGLWISARRRSWRRSSSVLRRQVGRAGMGASSDMRSYLTRRIPTSHPIDERGGSWPGRNEPPVLPWRRLGLLL